MQPLPTVDENPERCETCRFWVPGDQFAGGEGECHKRPPVTVTGPLGVWHGWPRVRPGWCGEWQAKRASIPTPPNQGV